MPLGSQSRRFLKPLGYCFISTLHGTCSGKQFFMKRRLPAEWEDQDGVLIAWPHENSDWRHCLSLVEPVFAEIAARISHFERVIVTASDPSDVKNKLAHANADMDYATVIRMDTNDTWARDFGPFTVIENDAPLLLDFGFNGWGLKFAADKDNLITRLLHDAGIFGSTPLQAVGLILEGGSIESDGDGTIMTTAECLLNPNRNPHLTREQIEACLARQFGADHFLWLNHGFLAGDDTDSHIDTLARLCPGDSILYVKCNDTSDEHFDALSGMEDELRSFKTRNGSPYRLAALPLPSAIFDEEGTRLPATYANFLVINDAVLVPTYRDECDEAALETIREVFPRRAVFGIDCLPLILQHGSLHCVTMQIPKGVLR
jgi:agmatine deiminase